jgi:hypothetical protein
MKAIKLVCAALLMLVVTAGPCFAITNVQAVPDQKNVTMGPGATITFTWVIDRNLNGGNSVDVRSPNGIFRVNGVQVATSPALRRIIPGDPKTFRIVESVAVPMAVMRRAIEVGQAQFTYDRDFDEAPFGAPVNGSLDVRVTGGMGGPISVARIQLTFDNGGTTFTTVPRGSELRARAQINTSGSGRLDAVWEVSEPNPDGSAFYRTLKAESRTLTAQQRIVIESPLLPTKSDGRINVRFRVKEPFNALQPPVITYFVTGQPGTQGVGKLDSSGPSNDVAVNGSTLFKWAPAKGAVAYRVQVMDAADGVIASQLVRGTQTTLSAFVLGQLQAPATYRWRVVAINEEGDGISASGARSFRLKSR